MSKVMERQERFIIMEYKVVLVLRDIPIMESMDMLQVVVITGRGILPEMSILLELISLQMKE